MIDIPQLWDGLPKAAADGQIARRRVSSSHPLDFFQGRDARGRYVLMLEGIPTDLHERLPSIAGVAVSIEVSSGSGGALTLTLQDDQQLSIFSALCTDLVRDSAGLDAGRRDDGARHVLGRLARWQELLQQRRNNALSREEAMGLVGELLFLRDYILPGVGGIAAALTWRGPYGDEQDFAVGNWIFEIKTQSSTADQFLRVSSAAQLDIASGPITVCHRTLGASHREDIHARTLNQIVSELRDAMRSRGGASVDILEAGLVEYGYETRREYDEQAWLPRPPRFFEVTDAFPRIVPQAIAAGIDEVRYRIQLAACLHFERNDDWVRGIIGYGGT